MRAFVGMLALLTLGSASSGAQSLCGAWKPVEVVIRSGPDAGRHTTDVQPGLMIFTENYYAGMQVRGFEPRPRLSAQATDEERGRVFTPFTANAGSYQLHDSTLTLTAIVSKNPNAITGNSYNDPVRVVGDTLWFGWASANRQTKWVRIERSCARGHAQSDSGRAAR